jgi:hypothetical protein
MKIGKYILFLSIVALTVLACRETTTDPNIPFETAVHGYGEFKTPKTFSLTDAAAPVNFKWRWVSIDKANTVNKVEFFIYFDEPFKDKDGNPKTAKHGGVAGETYTKLWKTVTTPAANFGYTDFAITQADVYNIYKANKFDYGDGKGSVDVFSRSGRTAAKPFIAGDKFIVRWVLYTADNRKFDSWTTAVCGDFVGANCDLVFSL